MDRGGGPPRLSVPGGAPEALSMVRVRRRDAPGKGDKAEWGICVHSGVGVQLEYPKSWEVREDVRRIVVAYPPDRGISLNLIVGTAEGSLEDLSSMALETPKQLQSRGIVDPAANLECVPTTFINNKGYELSFIIQVGGRMRRARQIWTLIEGRSFILSSGCPLEQEQLFGPTFQHIAESVQLVDSKTLATLPKKTFVPKALPSLLLLSVYEDVGRKFRFKYPRGFVLETAERPTGDDPCIILRRAFDGVVCDTGLGGHDHSSHGHGHGGHGHSHSHGGQECKGSHEGHGHTHEGHDHSSHGHSHSHGGHECNEPHEKDGEKEKESEVSRSDSIRTIEQQKPEETVEFAIRVLNSKAEAAFMEHITKLAGKAAKPTTERIGAINGKSIWYIDGDQKNVHIYWNKDGSCFVVSLRYPVPEGNREESNEPNVYDHLLRHLLQRFEYIRQDKEFVSVTHLTTFELQNLKPKITFTYPEGVFKVQMQPGGPFLVSFVHIETIEQEETNEEGQEKDGEKEGSENKGKKKVITMPRSIVGLVRGDTRSEISTLRKFIAVTKQQLEDSGADAQILEEKDVLIGGSRGHQILYRANSPMGEGAPRMQCLQRLAILGEHNYVLLFQTLVPHFESELALALPVLDSFHTFNN